MHTRRMPLGTPGKTGWAVANGRGSRSLAAAAIVSLLLAACGNEDGGPGPGPPGPIPTPNVLRLAAAAGAPGDTVTVALSLQNATPLAALQFDLTSDPAVLGVVDAAAASGRAAGFDAFLNPGNGTARIILTDLAGAAIIAPGDGPVATVRIAVASGAAPGGTPLTAHHATGVDPGATTFSIGGSTATLTVR